jgi:maltooligosyltrehalose trehalohydrolase
MIYQSIHSNGCLFRVWAPEKKAMTLLINDRPFPLQSNGDGYFQADIPDVKAGDLYHYIPDDTTPFPDPASAYQPEGIHGPSAIVDHAQFQWRDNDWKGLNFSSLIFYELHVGTFTPDGTFDAIIPRLHDLATLGINAIELMPVAQCPGKRNWGYDEVFLYAVQDSYGGPDGLKRLVDACHRHGISVFLDVIYNHVGGEGNILDQFAPYFSDKYHTPWGKAFNYDGPWSDGVKDFIVNNALYWAEHYHIDGLRLDAIHEIFDRNAVTIWDDLRQAIDTWTTTSGRPFYLVAESDLNSPRVVKHTASGGLGFDAQWLDDFHHALYVLLDPDGIRHYGDFGRLQQLAKAYTEGFVHTNEYFRFRHRRHGASSAGLPGNRFIVFNQNHDLPGNRPDGQRLSTLVDLPRLKLAAAAILLSPYIPLLFMGEEYGETTPFYFFSDYSDPRLYSGLKGSRNQQFKDFGWDVGSNDPQSEETFIRSQLSWNHRITGDHAILLDWHRKLIHLRRTHPLLSNLDKNNFRADLIGSQGIALSRHSADQSLQLFCLFNFFGNDLSCPGYPITDPLPPWGISVFDFLPLTGQLQFRL